MDIGVVSDVSIVIGSTGILLKIILDRVKPNKSTGHDQAVYNALMTKTVTNLESILKELNSNTQSIGVVVTSSNSEIKMVKNAVEKLADKSNDREILLKETNEKTGRTHARLGEIGDNLRTLTGLYSNTKFCKNPLQ